ncbi:uncharacterized protein G2W53_007877 [Senna tora]|uniref:Uncharacterized protein n=1 Tax=Senna tora TaxID=362788 RepID=A0A834X7G6_9FABA|nr:uncharacterized protein G2W53_007877 [Senna tora]
MDAKLAALDAKLEALDSKLEAVLFTADAKVLTLLIKKEFGTWAVKDILPIGEALDRRGIEVEGNRLSMHKNWQPPSHRFLNLNVDASVKDNEPTQIGCVIRDFSRAAAWR